MTTKTLKNQVRPNDPAYAYTPPPRPYKADRLTRRAEHDTAELVAFDVHYTLDEYMTVSQPALFLLDPLTEEGAFANEIDAPNTHTNTILLCHRDQEQLFEEFEAFTDLVRRHCARRLRA
jgi:hypothetical protein